MSSVLITFTGSTCSGKSTLLNFAREAGYSVPLGTTTRSPRASEKLGVDYNFLSLEEFQAREANGEFIESGAYRGNRYGVTQAEFFRCLAEGPTFLVIEPRGLEEYGRQVKKRGICWLKYLVAAPRNVLLDHFTARFVRDLQVEDKDPVVRSYVDRLVSLLEVESDWGEAANWTSILDGSRPVAENLKLIEEAIALLA